MPTSASQQQQASLLQQIQAYGGTASQFSSLILPLLQHFANAGMAVRNFDNSLLAPLFSRTALSSVTEYQRFITIFGKTMAVAGVALGSISVFQGIQDMFNNGVNKKGLFSLAQSAMGVAMGANVLLGHAALVASLSNPAGWAIAGGVVAFSVVWGLTHKKSSEEVALTTVNEKLAPVYWTKGPIAAVGVGAAAMIFGWSNTIGKPPVMSTLTMPLYYLENIMRVKGGPSPVPLNPTNPTTLIEPGCSATDAAGNPNPTYPACLKTDPAKVMIVTPTGTDSEGNPIVKVTAFQLYKNLQFISSSDAPHGCYIPFFTYVNGKAVVNEAVVNGLMNNEKLMQSVIDGQLDTASAQSAVQLAAASNKDCVDPATL